MKYAAIGPISIYLPETIETNEDLARLFPKWDMDLIYSKTGIRARHIAGPGSNPASDLEPVAAKLNDSLPSTRSTVNRSISCCSARRRPIIPCLLQAA